MKISERLSQALLSSAPSSFTACCQHTMLVWLAQMESLLQANKDYFTITMMKRILMLCTSCKTSYIEDITRWHEDMNFIFERQNNILQTSAVSE